MNALLVLAVCATMAVAQVIDDEVAHRALHNPDLFGGDMLGIDGPNDAERNAIAATSYRWPKGIIPYVIDSSLADQTPLIQQAFKHYHETTCLKFVPRTNENDYIRIFYGQGCYAHIGRIGGQQSLSLGQGCNYVGTIVHELMHALGFYHEHARSDRDEFVTIYLQNVMRGQEHNFAKLSPRQNILYTAFDYNSIMIYGNKSFSKDGKSDTLVAKNGQELLDPFNKQGMMESDITRVRKMYNC